MSVRLGLDTHSACTPTVDLHHDLVGTAFHPCRCPQVRTMSASTEKSIAGDMAAAVKAVKFEVSVVSEFPAPPYLSRSMRHAATPLPLAVANAARSFCFVVLTMIEKSVALSKLYSWSRNAFTAALSCAARSATRGRSQATKRGSVQDAG